MRSEKGTAGVRSRYIGYVVLNVKSYGDAQAGEDCYPGVVRGQVMGGLMNGRDITVALRKTLTNQRVAQVADLQNEDKLSYTPPGGYIAFEGVRSEGEKFTAQWLNRMDSPDAKIRSGMPVQIAPAYDRDGNVRRFQVNGATIYNAHILHVHKSEIAAGPDDLQSALAESLDARGAALVVLAPGRGADTAPRQTHLAVVGWRDGARISVGEAMDDFLARHGSETLQPHFDAGRKADVIPLEITRLGSRVCESIDAGGKHAVPISRYMTGGLGGRIESALRRAGPEVSEKLENAFLAQAHPSAKEAFASAGWKGVWQNDISRFFAASGVELPYVPKFGFAVSTAFLRPYAGSEGDLYLAKARPLTAALPRNSVPTPSDPEAHTRYYAFMHEAVAQLAEILPDSPSPDRKRRARAEGMEVSIHQENDVEADIDPGDSGTGAAFSAGGSDRHEPGGGALMNF